MCDEEYADEVDSAVFPGTQGGPLMHNVAGKAVRFAEAQSDEFAAYADQIVSSAKCLAEVFNERGLSLVSGGTDKHLLLVDLRESHPDLTGKEAESLLSDVGIIVNKNSIPGETRSPMVTSGIRVGTPELTTRGFEETEMETIAEQIVDVLDNPEDETVSDRVATKVEEFCKKYPIYE